MLFLRSLALLSRSLSKHLGFHFAVFRARVHNHTNARTRGPALYICHGRRQCRIRRRHLICTFGIAATSGPGWLAVIYCRLLPRMSVVRVI